MEGGDVVEGDGGVETLEGVGGGGVPFGVGEGYRDC